VVSLPPMSGRIGCWVIRLASFKFVVHHIRGTQNVIADTPSHMYEADIRLPVSLVLLELYICQVFLLLENLFR
jgi:hypothetical protein